MAVRAYVMSFVGGSPVEHELQRLVLVLRQECISEQAHEVEEVVTVRALVLLEDGVCECCTDGSEHSDRLVARLVQHDLDRQFRASPFPLRMHPTIEAGLVDVNQRLLFLDERGKLERKLPPFLLLLQHHALLVRVRADEVLDAVSVMKRAQARDRKFHSHLPLELLAPLMQGEPTPTLEGLVSPEVGGNISLDFEGGLRAAVGSPIVDVVGPLLDEEKK